MPVNNPFALVAGLQYVDGTPSSAGSFSGTVAMGFNGTDLVGLRMDSSDNLLVNVAVFTATVTVVGNLTHNNAAPAANNIGALTAVASAAAPTYTAGDQVLLSTDLAGNLRTTITGSFVANNNIEEWNSVAVSSPTAYGTAPTGTTSVIGVNAYVTNTVTVSGTVAATQSGSWTVAATQSGTWNVGVTGTVAVTQSTSPWVTSDNNAVAQGSTTSGEKGFLEFGAVTTANPAYVTGQSSPLSLDTAGNLRVSVTGSNVVTQGTSPWVVSLASTTITGTVAVTQSTSPWVVAGGLTHNNAAPAANNVGVLPAVASTAAPTYTTGDQVLLSTDLSGNVRTSVNNTVTVSGTVAATQSGAWTVAATQSGTWTVQPGNTANTTPWLVTVATALPAGANTIGAVTQASGPWTQNLTQVDGTALGAPSAYGTSPGAVNVIGVNAFITNTVPVTLTSTTITGTVAVTQSGTWTVQQGSAPWSQNLTQWAGTALGTPTNFGTTPGAVVAGSVNASLFAGTTALSQTGGSLNVNITGGSSGNAAASATGSAVPASGGYTAINVGGTLRGWTGVNPDGVVYAGQVDLASYNGTQLTGTVTAYGTAPTGNVFGVNANVTNTVTVSGTVAATQSGTWTSTVTQATAANLNATVVGTGTFAVQAAQSGTWNIGTVTTVSAVTAITNALPAGTNTIGKVDILGNAGATLDTPVASATQPANVLQAGGWVTAAAPTYATGTANTFSLDTAGNIRVNVTNVVGTISVQDKADATIASGVGTASGFAIGVSGLYSTTPPAPTNGQQVELQTDQDGNLLTFFGSQIKTGAAWSSATAVNTLQYPTGTATIGQSLGGQVVIVQLDMTSTITAGAVTFQGTYDGINWVTIPTAQVVNPQTYAQLANPYTFVASTNTPFMILPQGFQGIRLNLTTAITGTGTVTPFWNLTPEVTFSTVGTTVGGSVTVIGTLTNNNAAPAATNIGALVGLANTAAPTYANGDQVLLSVDTAGNTRTADKADFTVVSAVGTTPGFATQIGGQYNTTQPAPTNGQSVVMQIDQSGNKLTMPGIQSKVGAAWTTATAVNTLQYTTGTTTIGAPSGSPATLLQLDQTTTLTAGAVTFQGTYDGINWVTMPADQVLNATTSQILPNPYTFVASTNQPIWLITGGFQSIRLNLTTAITGTGSVTPYWNSVGYNPFPSVSLQADPTGGSNVATGSIGATKTAIKTSGGNVFGWYFYNSNTTVAYVQFFNLASAGVTLGTTAPTMSFGIPPQAGANMSFDTGIQFGTAITIAVTTTRAGATAPTNTLDYNIFYV